MSNFVSYARNNGFSPIQVPDTSERDLRQQQREAEQRRRAFQTGQENRQRVQTQLERNQQLEADNRRQNFELEDTFIKQQRAAEKRNFETRIRNAEQSERDAQQLMKFASSFSATAVEKTNELYKNKRQAEQDFAYSLYYKYGVTSEERAELDRGETEMKDLQESLNPVIADLRRRGASVEEISAMQNLSGYARYGANRAMVERAGRDFSAYALNDTSKYKVGDQMMSLAQAVSEGDELGVRTILDQQRTKYINEAVPGMDPTFLDKYMFDSMREFENQLASGAAKTRLNALKAEDAANKVRLLTSFVNDPQGQGGQLWVNNLDMSGKGNYAVNAAAEIERLKGLADANPDGVIGLIDQIGVAQTTNRATGQTGDFAVVNPGQWSALTAIRQAALARQVSLQDTRNSREKHEEDKLTEALLADLRGAPTSQWEERIKTLQSEGIYSVADKLASEMPNSSAEALRDAEVNDRWEAQAALGMPPTLEDISRQRDISFKLRQQWQKKAANAVEITDSDLAPGREAIAARFKGSYKQFIVVGEPLDDSLILATAAAQREYAQLYSFNRMNGMSDQDAQNDALNKIFTDPKYIPNTEDTTKQPVFDNFVPGNNLPLPESSVVQKFKNAKFDPTQVQLIEKRTFIEGLRTFYETGNLPSSFGRLQLAAESTPKVNLYDVINGQIQALEIEGYEIGPGVKVTQLQDIFQPPQFDEKDLSNSRQALQNYQDARIMLDYKPNPTRSEVARVAVGGIPEPQLTVTPAQRAAIDAVSGPESGALGYEAVNQGTYPDGTIVNPGLLSDLPQHRGKRVVDLTIREVLEIQDLGFQGSDSAWRRKGGVFAIGRYQFIPKTLAALVQRYNLNLDQKFSPQLQDWLFLKYLQEAGPTAWSGVHNDPEAQAIMRAAKGDPIADFESPSPWRQPDTMNPEVIQRYTERNGN